METCSCLLCGGVMVVWLTGRIYSRPTRQQTLCPCRSLPCIHPAGFLCRSAIFPAYNDGSRRKEVCQKKSPDLDCCPSQLQNRYAVFRPPWPNGIFADCTP